MQWLWLLLILCWGTSQGSTDTPIPATVVSVHDGDTLTVSLSCGIPQVCLKVPVRLIGVDTPELRDSRPQVKAQALQAAAFVKGLLPVGSTLILTHVKRDKYFRLDAKISVNGSDLAGMLIERGFAKPWSGQGVKPW